MQKRGNAVDRRHFSVYGRSGAGTCTEILRIVKTGNGDDNGSYPVDEPGSVQDLLQAAAHNENEEAVDVYPAFARIAKEEGFYEAASTFMQIAEIEAMHRCRFQKLAELLKDHTFFERCETGKWICTNCGHVHEGRQAPAVCPVCRHDRGYFLPYELACYVFGECDFSGSKKD